MAWTSALVAWVAVVPLWRFSQYTLVLAHEGGHAMFGALFGQKISSVTLSSGGGGVTNFPNKIPWLADLIITMAGYLGPSAFGLGGVFLLLHHQHDAVLWSGLVLLVLILFKVRNLLAFIAVIATGVVLYWVATHWSDPAQLAFGYFWVWFLLLGGVRMITNLFWATYQQDDGSDAAILEKLTLLPDVLWLAVFWLGSMGALLYGGAQLLNA